MGKSMKCSRVVLLLFAALVVSSESNLVTAWKPPMTIKYYVHDNVVPGPNATIAQVASASGNDTAGPVPLFGDVTVFDSPILKQASRSSLLLGSTGGELVSLKKPFHYWLTFTAEFNTTEYKGTYSGQGRFDISARTHEVAVIGGTGDFRGAKGYAVAERLIPATGIDPTDAVLIYTAHFYF